MTIPENALASATEAVIKLGWSGAPSAELALAALEASAPLIAAAALEEAADAFDDLPMGGHEVARIEPGTWEYFEIFPTQHLRDRAAAIRKEAGL